MKYKYDLEKFKEKKKDTAEICMVNRYVSRGLCHTCNERPGPLITVERYRTTQITNKKLFEYVNWCSECFLHYA